MESLEAALTQLDERRRGKLMLRKLAELRRIDVAREFVDLRNMSMLNSSDTVCEVCRRPIGQSVFVWKPEGVVMHAACAKKQSWLCLLSLNDTSFSLHRISLIQQTHHLNTEFIKCTWKSFRIVSLMKRFFFFSVFPWFKNKTSSSQRRFRDVLSEENISGFEWSISSRFNAASICAFSSA